MVHEFDRRLDELQMLDGLGQHELAKDVQLFVGPKVDGAVGIGFDVGNLKTTDPPYGHFSELDEPVDLIECFFAEEPVERWLDFQFLQTFQQP